jgi:hypothetical protein
MGFRDGDLEESSKDLKYSGLNSIDAFLEGSDETSLLIGKTAIAFWILWMENRERLFDPETKGNWYEYLWNMVRPGINVDNAAENKVSIITFNYERSFEYYFRTAIKHTLRLNNIQKAQWVLDQAFPIIHLHGVVGDTESFGSHSKPLNAQVVEKAASSIRVIHDKTAEDDPDFVKARTWISNASRIAFVGFGFHPENIRRLMIPETVPEGIRQPTYPGGSCERIQGTAYGLGDGEKIRARRNLGIPITLHTQSADAYDFLRGIDLP